MRENRKTGCGDEGKMDKVRVFQLKAQHISTMVMSLKQKKRCRSPRFHVKLKPAIFFRSTVVDLDPLFAQKNYSGNLCDNHHVVPDTCEAHVYQKRATTSTISLLIYSSEFCGRPRTIQCTRPLCLALADVQPKSRGILDRDGTHALYSTGLARTLPS